MGRKMDNLDIVCGLLSREELLAQLAEEAAELAHAALKLRRVYDGENPTPVTKEKAVEDLLEEIADVELCFLALERTDPWPVDDIVKTMEEKMERWIRRLEENR